MTRRLGGNGRSFSILATASLAAALACGSGAMVGCGSSSSNNNNQPDSGGQTEGGTDSGGHADAEAGAGDSGGQDANQTETSTNDAAMEAATALTAPTCAPPTGATAQSSESVTLTATGLPANGFIYYTTNGTNPNSGSTVYSAPITFGCQGNACPLTEDIRAIASAPGYLDSPVTNCSYTVTAATQGTVGEQTTFSPPAELSNNDIPVSITSDAGRDDLLHDRRSDAGV